MGIFADVKENITAREAAESYGIEVNRYGMAKCPFHNDRRPSMKLDHRFHCFGCGADGDAIDLTARLFDLSPLDAAKKLIQDFGLSIDTGYRDLSRTPPKRSAFLEKLEEQKRFRKWIADSVATLLDYRSILYEWQKTKAPRSPDAEWDERFVEAGKKLPYVEYLLDQLLCGDEDVQRDYYRNGRKEVAQYAERVREIRSTEPDSIGRGADDGPDRERSHQAEHSEHGYGAR
jgi:hypothetical protein